ncbi:MAG TPA: TIM barrel protein [Lacipirellulaceae bacterium]|nr:TIM barrel protein [Lacipirellulaceae bacterium]HMP05222.1 TIM barrel protein [Lacipirellulaceae bacterium]
MKICFLTFACPDWPVEEVVAAALRHRYHGVEFRCDAGQAHGVEVGSSTAFRRNVRRRLTDEGLEAPCLSTSIQLMGLDDPQEALARIQLASDIGARAVRVFCGPVPDPMSEAEVIDLAASRLRLLAQMSAPRNVEVWLETHDTLHRASQACAAVQLADHPAVGVNYDNMHPFRMHEPLDETFAALQGLVRHTHIHDALDDDDLHKAVILPLDLGGMPMDATICNLARIGYDGYLGGEWFNSEYGQTPNDSLASFREQMDNLVSRNGLTLMP